MKPHSAKEGTLDQTTEVITAGAKMSKDLCRLSFGCLQAGSGRMPADDVLRPLSEEFLYRSPVDLAGYMCRRCLIPRRSKDHASA
jgi:hypothetical protein